MIYTVPLPLRYKVPLSLFLLLIPFALFSLKSEIDNTDKVIEMQISFRGNSEGIELVNVLEHFLFKGDLEGARRAFVWRGGDADLNLALLVDENALIRMSTRFDLIGATTENRKLKVDTRLLDAVGKIGVGKQMFSGDRMTWRGYFPVALKAHEGELRSSRNGVLYMEFDLTREKSVGRREAYTRFFVFAALLTVVCLGFLVYFTIEVSDRIATLDTLSKKVAEGDYDVKPLLSGNDELTNLEKSFLEMAKKREAVERELESYQSELEEKVTKRTSELLGANKELEAFTYSVSHDLRAPLRSITSLSGIVIDEYGDQVKGEAGEFLSNIREISVEMTGLVDSLRRLSIVSRKDLKIVKVDLSELAWDVTEKVLNATKGRDIDIRIGQEMRAMCDKSLMSAVLTNLLGNAVKYTAMCDKAEIRFDMMNDKDGRRIFFVKDNGAGFNMKYVEKLFIPFQRLHRAADFKGDGIGLSTVQRIIHRLDGNVWGEGEEGKGATIYFSLEVGRTRDDSGSIPEPA